MVSRPVIRSPSYWKEQVIGMTFRGVGVYVSVVAARENKVQGSEWGKKKRTEEGINQFKGLSKVNHVELNDLPI